MAFQIICLKNRAFWNKVLSTFASFLVVVIVFAIVFPIKHNTSNAVNDLADATIIAAQTEQGTDQTEQAES